MSFVTLVVSNNGGKAARDVRIVVRIASGSEIRDRKVTFSSGPTGTYTDTSDRSLSLLLPVLAPQELVTISMIVAGAGPRIDDVGVRSQESVGEVDASYEKEPAGVLPKRTVIALIGGTLLLQLVALLYFRRHRVGPLFRLLESANTRVNNTAFIYLQIGLYEEAKLLLGTLVQHDGADPIILSNYALAAGLTSIDDVESQFHAAEWWAETSHEKAVIHYNRATLAFKRDRVAEGMEHMRQALRLSKKEVCRYSQISAILQRVAQEQDQLRELINPKA